MCAICPRTQIATRVPSVFRVSMPASVAALLDNLDGLNLNIDAIGLPLDCLALGSFFNRLLFVMLIPYVIALVIMSWCTISEALATSRNSAWLKDGLIRALPYLLGLSFFAFTIVSSLASDAQPEPKTECPTCVICALPHLAFYYIVVVCQRLLRNAKRMDGLPSVQQHPAALASTGLPGL